jgi:hypothetical protein
MKANLWNSLETLSTEAALLVEWQDALGEDFPSARVFLRPTQQQAESYPCQQPNVCGCRHRVGFESEDDVSALCDCDEAGCETISLRATDLIIHSLNGDMLAAAIRQAFQFDELANVQCEESRSRLVGRFGVRLSRVLFYVPISEGGLLKEIDRLCAEFPDPFVLLTPTSQFCTPIVQRALRRQGCAQMALCGVLRLAAPRILELVPEAKGAVDAFFNDFGKQVAQGKPLELAVGRVEAKLDAIAKQANQVGTEKENNSENVARHALALIKKLDAESRLKKPSLVTVFHLYCVNEMSATQIAKKCGCSKTAVVERLQILSQKIGMPAGRLRQHSAHFERIEEEMSDWRAKRVDRHDMADGTMEDSDEAP